MTPIRRLFVAALISTRLLAGCGTAPKPGLSRLLPDPGLAVSTRNNCYSLLHQLLNEEKDVSILRFIKHEDSPLKIEIKRVASVCGAAARRLEEFAKRDPGLALDDYRLPPGEKETRDSISSMKQKDLLHNSGEKFEILLVLTQLEALGYASHLAKVAGENDSQPERARYLSVLSDEMKKLRDDLAARLALSPPGTVPASR